MDRAQRLGRRHPEEKAMKDLLDRYLAAVARELPNAQRADITAELRDELLSKMEAREERLGRTLTTDELADLLVEFGNPLVVAGRYRKVQHLIGPEMFPFWWSWLKASLVVVAAVYLVLAILGVLLGRNPTFVADRGAPALSVALVFTFGAVTLTCALVERFGKPGAVSRWKPMRLPPAQGRERSRFEILVEMGMGLVFVLWWIGAIHFPNVSPELGLRVDLAPVWAAWFWPILAYAVFEFVINLLSLLNPANVRLNRSLRIARSLAGAGILLGVLQAGHWLDVTGPAEAAEAYFDQGMAIGLAATVLIFLGVAAGDAWRLRQFVRTATA
jgi:hypothetical protein